MIFHKLFSGLLCVGTISILPLNKKSNPVFIIHDYSDFLVSWQLTHL